MFNVNIAVDYTDGRIVDHTVSYDNPSMVFSRITMLTELIDAVTRKIGDNWLRGDNLIGATCGAAMELAAMIEAVKNDSAGRYVSDLAINVLKRWHDFMQLQIREQANQIVDGTERDRGIAWIMKSMTSYYAYFEYFEEHWKKYEF